MPVYRLASICCTSFIFHFLSSFAPHQHFFHLTSSVFSPFQSPSLLFSLRQTKAPTIFPRFCLPFPFPLMMMMAWNIFLAFPSHQCLFMLNFYDHHIESSPFFFESFYQSPRSSSAAAQHQSPGPSRRRTIIICWQQRFTTIEFSLQSAHRRSVRRSKRPAITTQIE